MHAVRVVLIVRLLAVPPPGEKILALLIRRYLELIDDAYDAQRCVLRCVVRDPEPEEAGCRGVKLEAGGALASRVALCFIRRCLVALDPLLVAATTDEARVAASRCAMPTNRRSGWEGAHRSAAHGTAAVPELRPLEPLARTHQLQAGRGLRRQTEPAGVVPSLTSTAGILRAGLLSSS